MQAALELAAARTQPPSSTSRHLISIDQFEEIFQHTDQVQRDFMRALTDSFSHPGVQVLATIRSDFLSQLQACEPLFDLWDLFPVNKFDMRRLPEIIVGPAHALMPPYYVDDALVRALQSDADTPDALPLVAFALADIWARAHARGDRRILLGDYPTAGRSTSPLKSLLVERAEAAVAQFATDNIDDVLLNAFIPNLVDLKDEGDPIRRRAPESAFAQREVDFLTLLARPEFRLIVVDATGAGERTFEVAHETLLRLWPRLHDLVQHERENLQLMRALERECEAWRPFTDRIDLLLLQGQRLQQTVSLREHARFAKRLNAIEDYIDACVREERGRVLSARESRLQREAAEDWRLQKEMEERIDRGEGLAAIRLAYNVLKADPHLYPRTQAEAVRALATSQLSMHVVCASRGIIGADISRHSGHVVSASVDGTVSLIDSTTGACAWTQRFQEPVTRIQFAPVGTMVAVGTSKGTIVTLDALTGRQRSSSAAYDADILDLQFSPDGKHLAAGFVDGQCRLFRADSLKVLSDLEAHVDRVSACAFSPDSAWLASASWDQRIRLVDLTRKRVSWIEAHDHIIRGLCFSPSGHLILSWSADGTASLHKPTGEEIQRFTDTEAISSAITSACFLEDEASIAAATIDGSLKLWTGDGQTPLRFALSPRAITECRYLRGRRAIMTSGWDGLVRICTLQDLTQVGTWPSFSADVSAPIITALATHDEAQTWCFDAAGAISRFDIEHSPEGVSREPSSRLRAISRVDALLLEAEEELYGTNRAENKVASFTAIEPTSDKYQIWPLVLPLGGDRWIENASESLFLADLSNLDVRHLEIAAAYGGIRFLSPSAKADKIAFLSHTSRACFIHATSLDTLSEYRIAHTPTNAAFLHDDHLTVCDAPALQKIVAIGGDGEILAEQALTAGQVTAIDASTRRGVALIGTNEDGVFLFDRAAARFTSVIDTVGTVSGVTMTQDGGKAAIVIAPDSLHILETRRRGTKYPRHSQRMDESAFPRVMMWSPDNARLLIVFRTGLCRVYTIEREWSKVDFVVEGERFRFAQWAGDSSSFLLVTNKQIRFIDAKTGRETQAHALPSKDTLAAFFPSPTRPLIAWKEHANLAAQSGGGSWKSVGAGQHQATRLSSRLTTYDTERAEITFFEKSGILRASHNGSQHDIDTDKRARWGQLSQISGVWIERPNGNVELITIIDGDWRRRTLDLDDPISVNDVAANEFVCAVATFIHGTEQVIHVFDTTTGVRVWTYPVEDDKRVHALGLSPSRPSLIVVHEDMSLRAHDIAFLATRGEALAGLFDQQCVIRLEPSNATDLVPAGDQL